MAFQSAPLTEARGDFVWPELESWQSSFNPLPSPKQGETCAGHVFCKNIPMVSIRSPHRSKGRHLLEAKDCIVRSFQSAPLTEARGDLGHFQEPSRGAGFNPLPSPKQGETDRLRVELPCFKVSIRSPHRSKGRRRFGYGCGRLGAGFNPLPSPKQGETITSVLSFPLVGVSIRSPHRSKGRRNPIRARGKFAEFQSAPLTEARGDRKLQPLPHPGTGFNPLPSPKQGETLVAITSGITKTYTGTCAIRSNSRQECPTRLPRNAITCCYAGSFQLRESKGKTPSLHFRARYKTSGSFKSTGSPTP